MPLLDVSDVLFDPMLSDVVSVVRRVETVNGFGESVVSTVTFDGIVGVVTASTPSDLIRRDDGQMMSYTISFCTTFRVQGPAPGYQPDQIVYQGVVFTVTQVMPFSRFGVGTIEVLATSMNAVNTPAT